MSVARTHSIFPPLPLEIFSELPPAIFPPLPLEIFSELPPAIFPPLPLEIFSELPPEINDQIFKDIDIGSLVKLSRIAKKAYNSLNKEFLIELKLKSKF